MTGPQVRRIAPAEVRFFAKLAPASVDECWIWSGRLSADGYGKIRLGRRGSKTIGAHRFAYEFFISPVEDSLVLDHLCRNRACVNPWHLDQVPNGTNVLRGESFSARNARKTHCPQGHSYAEHAAVIAGSRACLVCRREQDRTRQRQYRAKRKGELIPAEPYAGTRMFADVVAETRERVSA